MKPEKAFRIRLVKILEILRQETDEDNPMPTNTLIKKLAEQGIECDRRTLYRDIQVLNDYGYEVLCSRAISNEYYVVDRSFDIPELRILLDAVQAASFAVKACGTANTLKFVSANFGGNGASTKQFQKGSYPSKRQQHENSLAKT